MNALIERLPAVAYADGMVRIDFPGGAAMRFPVRGNRRLARGTEEELSRMEVSRFGIHWPALDEDLSFEGLSRGDYGQDVPPAGGRG